MFGLLRGGRRPNRHSLRLPGRRCNPPMRKGLLLAHLATIAHQPPSSGDQHEQVSHTRPRPFTLRRPPWHPRWIAGCHLGTRVHRVRRAISRTRSCPGSCRQRLRRYRQRPVVEAVGLLDLLRGGSLPSPQSRLRIERPRTCRMRKGVLLAYLPPSHINPLRREINMTKSRTLVLALSLSVGLLGIHAGSPAAISVPVSTGSAASPAALEVAQAPVADAVDVTGSGPDWMIPACLACFSVASALLDGPLVIVKAVGAYVLSACYRACL